MRPQDLRALRATRAVRPPTPWLLIAFDWVLEQVCKAPRPVRLPLLYAALIAGELLLPVRLLLLQEVLNDRLYPEPAQS